jgi:hypothetical protein
MLLVSMTVMVTLCTATSHDHKFSQNISTHRTSFGAHNHICQHELGLEEHWVTKDCWFRLDTTFIGITVTDCLKACRFGLRQTKIDLTMKEFAERMAFDCMHNPFGNELGPADFIGDDGEDQGRPNLVVNPAHTRELSPELAFVHAMNMHRFAKTSRRKEHWCSAQCGWPAVNLAVSKGLVQNAPIQLAWLPPV